MINEILEVSIDIITTSMDLIMFHCLCYNLIEKKVILTYKLYGYILLWGTVSGAALYYLDDPLFALLPIIITLLYLTIISKKRIYEVLVIYVICVFCMSSASFIIALLLSPFSISDNVLRIIGQSATLLIVLLEYKKIPMYKFFKAMEKHLVLRLFMFFISGSILIFLFHANFEFSDMRSYILYPSIFTIISFIILFRTIKKLFGKSREANIKVHDMRNVITGLYVTANVLLPDDNNFKPYLEHYLGAVGYDITINNIKVGQFEKSFFSFIEDKKQQFAKKILFINDVSYDCEHKKVLFPSIIYMFGILLDNAIEASTNDNPIENKIIVMENYLMISVANEYKRHSVNDFNEMFREGYSTKTDSKDSRGYGLPNLSRIVKKYNGEIKIEFSYRKQYKSEYIIISIQI